MIHMIPASLLKQIVVLKCPKTLHRIYLIGTAHVSKESCESVRELIGIVKPRAVFLELCDNRLSMTEDSGECDQSLSYKEEISDLMSGWSNIFTILYSRLLRQAGKDLDTQPGGEFVAARDAAKLCNAFIILGDRDVHITIRRLWGGLSFYKKGSIIFSLLAPLIMRPGKEEMKEMIENLKSDKNIMLDAFIDIGEQCPWVLECLLFERDLYMLHALLHTLQSLDGDEACDIVAVVGSGHVPGISRRWNAEMNFPGSEVSEESITEIIRMPGALNDAENISPKDLRAYADSRESLIAQQIIELKLSRAKALVTDAPPND